MGTYILLDEEKCLIFVVSPPSRHPGRFSEIVTRTIHWGLVSEWFMEWSHSGDAFYPHHGKNKLELSLYWMLKGELQQYPNSSVVFVCEIYDIKWYEDPLCLATLSCCAVCRIELFTKLREVSKCHLDGRFKAHRNRLQAFSWRLTMFIHLLSVLIDSSKWKH